MALVSEEFGGRLTDAVAGACDEDAHHFHEVGSNVQMFRGSMWNGRLIHSVT